MCVLMIAEWLWSTPGARRAAWTCRSKYILAQVLFCCKPVKQHFLRRQRTYFIFAGSSLRGWASEKGRPDHRRQWAESGRGDPRRSRGHPETDERHGHPDGSLLKRLPELSQRNPSLPSHPAGRTELALWCLSHAVFLVLFKAVGKPPFTCVTLMCHWFSH